MTSTAVVTPITGHQAVSLEQLVERARGFVPMLREAAPVHEANRRVSAEVMQALNEAGLLDVCKPARFGGREFGPSAVVKVVSELGRGDGSTAWCAMLASISAWFVSFWSLQAQEDIWLEKPDALVCGMIVPTGQCKPVEGGYEISGQWPFASNCENSDWVYVSAMLPDADGVSVGPALFLTPFSSLRVDQSSWNVAGLGGSGSKTLHADAPIFVPAHRMVRLSEIHSGTSPGQLLPDNPLSNFWFGTFGGVGLIAPLLGMAQGALDWFTQAMQTKARVQMKPGAPVPACANPFVQQRAGFAATAIDSAKALILQDLADIEARIFRGEAPSVEDRIRIRRDIGFVAQQTRSAVDTIMIAAGASASDLGLPLQRFWRDLNAGARHASLDVDGINMLVGQNMFGMPLTGSY